MGDIHRKSFRVMVVRMSECMHACVFKTQRGGVMRELHIRFVMHFLKITYVQCDQVKEKYVVKPITF